MATFRFGVGTLTALALLSSVAAGTAGAHEMGVECKLRGPQVVVEAFFEDDTPARDARVLVRSAGEEVVAEGKTEESGRWRFPKPAPGSYRVFVDAGDGHRARTTLTIPAEPGMESTPSATVESSCPEGCCAPEASVTPTVPSSLPWMLGGSGVAVLGILGFGYRRLLGLTRRPTADGSTDAAARAS